MVDQTSFIRERPFFANKKLLSRIFRELPFIFRGTPCWATTPLMKIHSSPAKSHQIITDNFFIAFKHAASITESPSQDMLLLIKQFSPGLLGHSLQNALWLSPSQNFRRTFAKIPLSPGPSHQQGAHQRKSKHQGPWCLALAKPHF